MNSGEAAAGPVGEGRDDIAALAKGGLTNFFGFFLRLAARVPFLFIAGRLYGAEALGRFASAVIVVELCGLLATLGLKRGLAQRLTTRTGHPANLVADGLLIVLIAGLVLSTALLIFPAPLFPSGVHSFNDRLLPLAIVPLALTELALAAQAYRFDVKATVYARAVVEPFRWPLSPGMRRCLPMRPGQPAMCRILTGYGA